MGRAVRISYSPGEGRQPLWLSIEIPQNPGFSRSEARHMRRRGGSASRGLIDFFCREWGTTLAQAVDMVDRHHRARSVLDSDMPVAALPDGVTLVDGPPVVASASPVS